MMAIGFLLHKHFYMASIEQSVLDHESYRNNHIYCCVEETTLELPQYLVGEMNTTEYYEDYDPMYVNVTQCDREDQLCKFYNYSNERTMYISIFAVMLSVISIPYLVCGLLGLKRQKTGLIASATANSLLVVVMITLIIIIALYKEYDAFYYYNRDFKLDYLGLPQEDDPLKDLSGLFGKYFTHSNYKGTTIYYMKACENLISSRNFGRTCPFGSSYSWSC